MFTVQPGGKASHILGVECNQFGNQIVTKIQLLLPRSDLIYATLLSLAATILLPSCQGMCSIYPSHLPLHFLATSNIL